MQFFGARANLAKCLLYAINGGVDEKTKDQVAPRFERVSGDILDYDDVLNKFNQMTDWLAGLYVNTLNVIHHMHDRYYYEAAQMALLDTDLQRTFATGIAGFSHVVDSLSAIKYAKVHVIRDSDGIVTDFKTEGDFPALRQRRRPRGRYRAYGFKVIYRQDKPPRHLQKFSAHNVHTYDNLKCRIRKGNR